MFTNTDPRTAMADRLPAFFQPFLTWLTSKALPGQKPLFRNSPVTQILTGFGLLFFGAAGGAVTVHFGGSALLMLPVFWIVAVAGARYLQTNILHQASHACLVGNGKLDRLVGNLISITVLIPSFDLYKATHIPHHQPGTFASIDDPDFRFFRGLGFEPGLPMQRLWRRFWKAILGPGAHLKYMRARLSANLVESGRLHASAAVFFQMFLAFLMAYFTGRMAYLWAWLFPMTVIFQISSILQYLTEHRWLLARKPGDSLVTYLNQLTVARFTGSMPPAQPARSLRGVMAWAGWWFHMLTYHLFIRVFVTQGPLGVHDFHHRVPLSPEWPNSLYARQPQIDSGNPQFANYGGVWGFHNVLRASLQSISAFPRMPSQQSLSRKELDGGFRSM